MLFVHFTPKANVKRIKRAGLRPSKGEERVFLRPLLQGEKVLVNDWNAPKWWRKGTARHDREMGKSSSGSPTTPIAAEVGPRAVRARHEQRGCTANR